MTDTLSNILQVFKLKSAFYFQSDFPAPWGMEIEEGINAQFHMIVRGTCSVFHDGLDAPIQLSAGDVIVFPKGTSHWIADNVESGRLPGTQVVQAIANKQTLFGQSVGPDESKIERSGQQATLICGHFELERELEHPLLRGLPEMILIKNTDQEQTDLIGTTSRMIIQESASGRPGSPIILEKMAEALLVLVLRAYLKQENHTNGFARALTDPRIARSIDALHNKPEYSWTIEELAREAGLSRTAFAVLFKQLTGTTPMQYCMSWRMTLAHRYLRQTTWSIPDLAERVGYQSEAAFTRAFKRCFSVTPARLRRTAK